MRLGSLGDIIHTLPAVEALRNAFPAATIGWIVEERWAELLCSLPTPRSGPRSPQRPLVDIVHAVNTKAWRRSLASVQTWEQIAAAVSDLRAAKYEVAVDFQGAIRSALISRISGAPVTVGFAQPREKIASMFYTREVIGQGTHIVEQNLSLAAAVIGAHAIPPPAVQFPCDEIAEQQCDHRLRELGTADFVLLSPGAGWGAKQWPAQRYGEVAQQLAQDGMISLINYGPGEEKLAKAVEAASGASAVPISCSLAQLIVLTRRASLFIGGDSGPLHLAAALGVPVVGIFGPTDPARNGPFCTRNIVLRSSSSRTSLTHRDKPDPGLHQISTESVISAARQLLGLKRD